ncbi:MAG: hypothetical protein ACLQRH_09685 [Acidimicrobiales bacterium]
MQTIGENDVLHPRAIASPLVYGAAKRDATAADVATVRAAVRLFVDQLETRAVAAASALGLSVDGGTTAVVVVAWDDEVVVVGRASFECPSPE